MAEQQRPDRSPRKPNRPTPPGGLRYGRGLIGWMLFILLVVMVIVMFRDIRGQYQEIAISELWGPLERDLVLKLEIDGNEGVGEFRGAGVALSYPQPVKKFRVTL